MPLEDLLNFLNTDPHLLEGEYDTSTGEKYIRQLDEKIPDWREVVKNPKNWSKIEETKAIARFRYLCEVFIYDAAGFKLAVHWFNSQHKTCRDAARDYFENLDLLNSSQWKKLCDEIKRYIINHYFYIFPGEPFDRMLRLFSDPRHPRAFPSIFWPPMEYVPSVQIRILREIVKDAGDKKYLEFIDELIEERKQACSAKTRSHLIPYTSPFYVPYSLSPNERELVAKALKLFIQNGYKLKPLPQVYLSSEAPPIFCAYPELERADEEQNEREKEKHWEEIPTPRYNQQREMPEVISIEELLGCYVPDSSIILWVRGINWLSKRKNYDREFLQAIVLLHEMGHWITHQLPSKISPEWKTELYISTEEDVHEGWAQLITWWVVCAVGGEIKHTFESLSLSQPSSYRVYEDFKTFPIGTMIESLEELRNLKWPARLSDWKKIVG